MDGSHASLGIKAKTSEWCIAMWHNMTMLCYLIPFNWTNSIKLQAMITFLMRCNLLFVSSCDKLSILSNNWKSMWREKKLNEDYCC